MPDGLVQNIVLVSGISFSNVIDVFQTSFGCYKEGSPFQLS